MRHIFAIFVVALLFGQTFAFAETKEIISEGTYNMGDGETPTVAESRALLQAKRTAVEEAGTYVESYSKTKNFQLTVDEIQVLASGIMEVEVLEKKRTVVGDGFNFWIKIKARVSTDKMEEMAKRVKEKSVVEDYKKIQAAYDKSQKEIEELKRQLAGATGGKEKKRIEAKMADDERLLQAKEWFEKGYQYWLNKEYDEAIEAYTSAIALDLNDADAYTNRGAIYDEKGQPDMAIEDYNKAIALDPNDAIAYYNRGLAYYHKGQYDRAIEDYNRVIALDPNYEDAYYSVGLAYGKVGELQKAFRHYMKVDEINAVEARDKYRLDLVFYNLGIAYQKEGNLDEAVKAYQEAIRINPEQANAYCIKGEILYQKKDYKSALESLMICREKNPEKKNVNRYISAIYQNKGIDLLKWKNYAQARTELEKAIASDPTNETVHYYKGYVEYLAGDHVKALEALDKIKDTEKEDMKKVLPNMFYNIGAAMQKKEDWQGAITAFSRAIEINSADPELHYFLGYSYMKAKKSDLALEAYKEALRLNPKHQGAALNLEKMVTVGENRDISQ